MHHLHVHDDLILRAEEAPEGGAGGRCQKIKAPIRVLVKHDWHTAGLHHERGGTLVVGVLPAGNTRASRDVREADTCSHPAANC